MPCASEGGKIRRTWMNRRLVRIWGEIVDWWVWQQGSTLAFTITVALAEKIYFSQQDFECGVYLPTSSPRPAFVADKKLFAWLWEEPSHILSFSPAPPRNDDDSHPFLPLEGSFSIFAAVQPFLPLLDTSFPFLLLQASPTHAFSTQLSTSDLPETNHCDCTKSRKEKGDKEWVGGNQ